MAVAGHDDQPYIYYTGFTGGGVCKQPMVAQLGIMFDGFFKTGSVGAIDVVDSDPNVYVGMGETIFEETCWGWYVPIHGCR